MAQDEAEMGGVGNNPNKINQQKQTLVFQTLVLVQEYTTGTSLLLIEKKTPKQQVISKMPPQT